MPARPKTIGGRAIRTIVHISDIHFGRTHEATVQELVGAVHRLEPDLVAVSGDLTQRARREEFQSAVAFLESLPKPQIVVPGNHDVPSHNPYARFRTGLASYRRYISDDLAPFYRDEEVAVLGLSTARRLTIKGGRVSQRQIETVEEKLCGAPGDLIKIIVTHHPFDLPSAYGGRHLVGRAGRAMARFARCGVDILLAGHHHVSHCGRTAERYQSGNYSAIFVQAGTACSTRRRGEPNSFNILKTQPGEVTIETVSVDAEGRFHPVSQSRFLRRDDGWTPAAPEVKAAFS